MARAAELMPVGNNADDHRNICQLEEDGEEEEIVGWITRASQSLDSVALAAWVHQESRPDADGNGERDKYEPDELLRQSSTKAENVGRGMGEHRISGSMRPSQCHSRWPGAKFNTGGPSPDINTDTDTGTDVDIETCSDAKIMEGDRFVARVGGARMCSSTSVTPVRRGAAIVTTPAISRKNCEAHALSVSSSKSALWDTHKMNTPGSESHRSALR